MLKLTISKNNGKHVILKDKLENLSLSKTIVLINEQTEPLLKEGEKIFVGYEEIYQFLEDQETFVRQWYECRCGNHGKD